MISGDGNWIVVGSSVGDLEVGVKIFHENDLNIRVKRFVWSHGSIVNARFIVQSH